MEHLLNYHWALSTPLIYLALLAGVIIEGDVTLFTAAFLVHEKILNPWSVSAVALGGLLLGDLFWFWLGRKLHANFWLYRRAMKYAAPFDRHLGDRPARTLFVSKYLYGLGHFIMIRAGSLGMRFSDFCRTDFPATLVWFLAVGGLGYLAGASYELARRYFQFAEVALLLGLIVLFAAQGLITYSLNRSNK
jgi:membrane protein DedA with SNARE-associated domain